MENDLKRISKLMSLVLRHKPEQIGIVLDANGWAEIAVLIEKMNQKGYLVTAEILEKVVADNDKQRFTFNDDKTRIRANQGHSIEVDVELTETVPPAILFHGTAIRHVESIMKEGLKKQNRQYVHLSASVETAATVGSRHGKPIVLIIDSKAMFENEIKFYLSKNNVWLTDFVDTIYIKQ
jgi:putative RNA 2'-phosphotransferase